MFGRFESPKCGRIARVVGTLLLTVVCRPAPVIAAGTDAFDECLKDAVTQTEVDDCAASSLKAANAELESVYRKLLSTYKDEPDFIERLKRSQRRWRQSRAADFAMMYPHAKDQGYYGSAFGTCAPQFKVTLIRQRIEFLRQWLHGAQDGDLCAGSRKMQFQLRNRN